MTLGYNRTNDVQIDEDSLITLIEQIDDRT